jgi:hypothetical protein
MTLQGTTIAVPQPVPAMDSSDSGPSFAFERVSLSPPNGKMSPGSIFGNRICLGSETESQIFWATGSSLFQLSLGPAPPLSDGPKNYSGKYLLPAPVDRDGSSTKIESLNGALKHENEVQHLAFFDDPTSIGTQRLYSVDSSGQAIINTFSHGQHTSTTPLEKPSTIVSDHGWVGISANPFIAPSLTVTCRYADKLVTVYDQDRALSRFRTVGHPMQMQVLDNGMIAMTEQGSYSVWDLRLPPGISSTSGMDQSNGKPFQLAGVGGSGQCVQRVFVSSQPLYAMDVRGTKIGVAGAERCAVVFDLRGEGAEARWNNCLKYDVTRFLFSRSDPSLCYVSGLDNELLVGKWDGTLGLSHFDGPHIESHWIGISNNNPTDSVYGLAQSGHVYICKNVPSLLDNVTSANRRTSTSSPRPSESGDPNAASSSTPTVLPHQRTAKKQKKTAQPPPSKKAKYQE